MTPKHIEIKRTTHIIQLSDLDNFITLVNHRKQIYLDHENDAIQCAWERKFTPFLCSERNPDNETRSSKGEIAFDIPNWEAEQIAEERQR